MTKTGTTTLRIATDIHRRQKQAIEGPTRRQAVKMAEYRKQLLALSAASPEDPRAFDWDCEAFDIEADLITYGFNPETGKVAR